MADDIDLNFIAKRIELIISELAIIRARVDGLPLIGEAIETLRRDSRLLRAAINDMARTNITAGEVDAMHTDIDAVQSRQMNIETRLATLERLISK